MRSKRVWIFLMAALLLGAGSFVVIRRVRAQELAYVSALLQAREQAATVDSEERTSEAGDAPVQKATVEQSVTLEQPRGQTVEVQRVDESKTDAQRAVVKVVLVFFQDISRRAVEGVLFSTGEETWVVVAATATVVPKDTPHAVDRVYVEGIGASAIDAEYVYSVPGLNFYRLPGLLTNYRLADGSTPVPKVSVDDELVALKTTNLNGRFLREPTKVTVTKLNLTHHLKLDSMREVREFSHLFQVSHGLPEGTPVFRDGLLAGITLIGTRFWGGKEGDPKASLIIPMMYLREDCRRAIALQATEAALQNSGQPLGRSEPETRAAPVVPELAPKDKTDSFVQGNLEFTQQIYYLDYLEPEDTAKTLRSLFADVADGQGIIRIAANTSSKSIIVNAPKDTVLQMEATVKALEMRAQKNTEELDKKLDLMRQSPARESTSLPSKDATIAMKDPMAAASPRNEEDVTFDRDAKQLAAGILAAEGADQEKLKRELQLLVDRHFEQRQVRRKQEIDDLAHRVDVMRVTHAKRNEQKAAIVKRRIAELLGNHDDLPWEESSTVDPTKVQNRTAPITQPVVEAPVAHGDNQPQPPAEPEPLRQY